MRHRVNETALIMTAITWVALLFAAAGDRREPLLKDEEQQI